MIVPYGYYERQAQFFRDFIDAVTLGRCTFRALDLMKALTYPSFAEFEVIISRSKIACRTLGIPIRAHYREVYVSSPNGLYKDYQLSRLACYLITIYADPAYPAVAKAQIYLATGNRHV